MSISPRGNFKGYDLKVALLKNKDSVKAVLTIIVGASVIVGVDWKQFLMLLAGSIIALGSKIVWDAFDYWFSEVEV